MNANLLIDAVISQCAKLVATVAVMNNDRRTLNEVSERFFLALANELEDRAVPQRVVADMFGVTDRTYQRKLRKAEDAVVHGEYSSMWHIILEMVQHNPGISRQKIEDAFRGPRSLVVRSILRDLVENNLIREADDFVEVCYEYTPTASMMGITDDEHSVEVYVWGLIFAKPHINHDALVSRTRPFVDDKTLGDVLDQLISAQRITLSVGEGGVRSYKSTEFLPNKHAAGWESAVAHQLNIFVQTIVTKLDWLGRPELPIELVGGSTYTFQLDSSHPYREQVLGTISTFRETLNTLWSEVNDYNQNQGCGEPSFQYCAYIGQSLEDYEEFVAAKSKS